MKNRRGIFGLDAVGLIGFVIVIVITMSIVAQAFTTQLQGAYVDLVSHMPTFGNATSTIGNTTSSVTHTVNHSLKFMTNLDLFNLMRNAAISGLSLVIMFAGFSLMFENIKLMSPGTAYQIVSKGIFIVLFLFIFPTLWDAWAGAIEYGSQWLLDPANSGKSESVQIVFNYVTGDQAFFGPNIQTPGVLGLNPDGSVKSPLQILIQILDDPSVVTTYISNQLQAVLLSVIGGVITLIITILTFMFATIRQVLTAVLIIALPLILVINLIPFFQPITRKLIDALIGLSIVPIFSSLVLTAGAVYLNTLPTGELQGWFASISVLVLSAFMPIMLVPMIGSLFQSVTGLVSSGVMSGTMLMGNVIGGGARGLSSALGSAGAIADASGAKISPFDIAKTAMAGMGTGVMSGTIKGLSGASGEALGYFGLGKQSRQMIQNGGATVGDSILSKAGQVGQASVIGPMSEVIGANARAMLLDSAALGSPSDPQTRADALASFDKNYVPMLKMSPSDITDKLGFGNV
ncbi:MAG: hypothetical protein KGI08_08450, partial [Thaumarchaeota archaeon]|nr:hypothetical protein [Nitrososphaerota archaeon]